MCTSIESASYNKLYFREMEVFPVEMKLPFYMMYPTPFLFDDDKKQEKDYEYLKSMYPETAKQILPYVEEECDRMEYDGSMIYDEYPDKLQLRLMCSRIYDKVMDGEEALEIMSEEEKDEEALHTQEGKFSSRRKPDRIRDMVELLLYQELFRRREQHRHRRGRQLW